MNDGPGYRRALFNGDDAWSPLPPTRWHGRELDWGARTLVMAILNLTPDSFSSDGLGGNLEAALAAALEAVEDDADILDFGAESTRPGHVAVSADEELARLLPALAAIRPRTAALLSVDTSKAAVAAAALAAGADLINDVRGFIADPEMAAVVAAAGVPAVIMHDVAPESGVDLMTSILRELSRRLDRAVAAGVAWERLIVDPGFGFGKDWRQNLDLLRRFGELRALDRPILAGTSRKSTIGRVLGLPEGDRLEGTAATVALAIAGGADIVRVHDVRAMTRVARMTDAVVRRAPDAPLSWPGGAPLIAMTTAYIGLGANLGDRAGTLREAVKRLGTLGRITAVSSLYETEPVGFLEQPPFLNSVAALKTERSPAALFHALIEIERDLGRTRTFRNAPRTLDLDVLLADDLILNTPELTLPHPRMHERAFVLAPLAEIAPDAVHPVLRVSMSDLLSALPDRLGIELWASPGWENDLDHLNRD